jgi:hypothetical protein
MDRRDRAALRDTWYKKFDPQKMVATILRYTEDDSGDEVEEEIEIPCVFSVCGTCEGRGSHVNPSIDSNGITEEEFARDWDQDEIEGYFSGVYDVQCYECEGQRVVPVPDDDHLTPELKKVVEKMGKSQAQAAREDADDAFTRRMESGGY